MSVFKAVEMAHTTLTAAGKPVGMSHNINSELMSQGLLEIQRGFGHSSYVLWEQSANPDETERHMEHIWDVHLELILFMSRTETMETHPVLRWEFIYTPCDLL